jgi:TRAP-type C4-dicarboxylate transport system substrate-binding protein
VILRWALLAILLSPTVARAEQVLRIATIVPDGTAWAREFRALSREVATASNGELQLKWYMSGVAGDELKTLERIQRGQLDGTISGGTLCERLAPSFRVMRIPGLFQSRAENAYVLGRLKTALDKEFADSGFTNLVDASVGPDIVFSRAPISSMQELRKARLWVWDLDRALSELLPLLGLNLVLLPIEQAARAYDDHRHDAFLISPTAALSFQFSAQVKYFTELGVSYISGCFLVANRSFDQLPTAAQRALRTASAKIRTRLDTVIDDLDGQLVGGLLQKQGVQRVEVSSAFRADFFQAAHEARERAVGHLVPQALVDQVLGLLADFRAAQ